MKYIFQILLLIYALSFTSCENRNNYKTTKSNTTLISSFEKIESSYSNIAFINKLTPNLENKSNLFDYDYFYNGSGVGIADFNNDGLKDIVLSANQTAVSYTHLTLPTNLRV